MSNAQKTIKPDATLEQAADRIAQERATSDAAQQARINSGPAPRDPYDTPDGDFGPAAAANAKAQLVEWQGHILARLGLGCIIDQNIPNDNRPLLYALSLVAAAGAPAPTVTQETIAWPGGSIIPAGAITTDVYTYTDPHNPNNKVRANEFLIAVNPAVLIGDLVTAGIITR